MWKLLLLIVLAASAAKAQEPEQDTAPATQPAEDPADAVEQVPADAVEAAEPVGASSDTALLTALFNID